VDCPVIELIVSSPNWHMFKTAPTV